MAWIGTYTDETQVIRHLQGRLVFSSGSGQVGKIVPVIEDDLFVTIADKTEAYVTSVLSALYYRTPLELTSAATVAILQDIVSKQIIYELFLTAPQVRDTCTCGRTDEDIDDIIEEYRQSFSNLCRDITECKIRLEGEVRDPDPCRLQQNNAEDSQYHGLAARTGKRGVPTEEEDRLFGHHSYSRDHYDYQRRF